MLFKHIFVVGAGGIGTHLLEPLSRMFAYHERGTRNLTIIDGDTYEEKNRTRQLFSADLINLNKAEAATKRLNSALGEEKDRVSTIKFIGGFVNRYKFREIIEQSGAVPSDRVCVIAAVDNHATRKDLILALEDLSNEFSWVFISGGNGYSNGQAVIYAKERGIALTLNPMDKYPDLKHPDDHIPGEGCQDEAPSTPQLITANASAALGILLTLQAMLDNKPWYEEIHFDCEKMKLVPLGDVRKIPTPEELSLALAAQKPEVVKTIELPQGLFSSDEQPALASQ